MTPTGISLADVADPRTRVATVYLGQFTDENADRITDALDAAGIEWSAKSSGAFVRFIFAADWGVRLFVDTDRTDEAWDLVAGIAPDGLARRPKG